MSEYRHIKALRYKPTEEEIKKLEEELENWKNGTPEEYEEYSYIDTWGEYLEHKFPDLIGYKKRFDIGFGETERYLDLILLSKYGDGEWYRTRFTTPDEQAKYRAEFEQIIPGLCMSRVHLVDFCYYDGCEPADCWAVETDPFYQEV